MSTTRRLKIDITSDTVCPFCLLGMKQLETAIERFQAQHAAEPLEVDIRMHPFQLRGDLTESPQCRRHFGEERFGEERWDAITKQLEGKFHAEGLKYACEGKVASSHLGHRLVAYAAATKPEVQTPLAMALLSNYHEYGRSPADRDDLAALGVKFGLFQDTQVALAWLAGTECDLEVKKAYQVAKRNNISGVPFFVFQDKYAASGAMGVDEFVGILTEIFKREDALTHNHTPISSTTGATCIPA